VTDPLEAGLGSAKLPLLVQEAASYGITLNEKQLQQFSRYMDLLIEWNMRINLTAIVDRQEIEVRHFIDSLACTTITGNLSKEQIMDVGSGAGFPGLPLKIVYPSAKLFLLDSSLKKCQFLEVVIFELGLKDVSILNDRVEDIGHSPDHRSSYDWVLARGVAKMNILAEYMLPLCRQGGSVIAFKGKNAKSETRDALTAFSILGGSEPKTYKIKLPGSAAEHYLVVVEKVGVTPVRYPRRVGIPKKRPL
jgi:16S rRNA (guanine527-N7)-methyltransferase